MTGLSATVALFLFAFWIPEESIGAIAAIVALFVGLPVCILLYRDGVRAKAKAGPSNPIGSVIYGLPIRVVGIASMGIGLVLISWLAYNLLIARQPGFTGIRNFEQLLFPLILVVYGYRWLTRPLADESEGR